MSLRASLRSVGETGDWLRPGMGDAATRRSNRRRLYVFLGTLIVAAALSLGYVWTRPAEYRASARVEITPATASAPAAANALAAAPDPEPARPFLTEVQILTSRPVLEQVATRLERRGRDLSIFGSDPAAGMQASMEVLPVPKTNVVELVAVGPNAELLAPLVNTTIEVYRDRLAEAFKGSSSEALTQADDEVKKLEANVAAKRRDIETFRLRYNIVSLEREENSVLAQVRNLGTSLSLANEKAAAAEGKLRALTESAAAGNAVVRARDDPTLANLEQRASQAREELRDMERAYTQDYLAREPKAIALRARLAELDRQIKVQRETAQSAAIADAQQEYASATGAVARLKSQIATGRQEVGQFTTRYNEYKSQQDDLTELEKTYRDAAQKRARLEASERARMPATKVIEPATTPQQPWSPAYWRDTAISIGGSLVIALLAMWLVELFNRREPQPAVVMVRPSSGGLSYEGAIDTVPRSSAAIEFPAHAAPVLLRSPMSLPRELGRDEVVVLLKAADEDGRLVVLLLLSGISADEAIALHWSDVHLARGVIRVGGDAGRDIPLSDPLRNLITERTQPMGTDPLLRHLGRPATHDGIDAQILCCAHDAGLEDAATVTADCLRHTYVAYLVRQGIRFADLTRVVGELSAELLGAYSAFAPPGPRVARETIDTTMPGLRADVAG